MSLPRCEWCNRQLYSKHSRTCCGTHERLLCRLEGIHASEDREIGPVRLRQIGRVTKVPSKVARERTDLKTRRRD